MWRSRFIVIFAKRKKNNKKKQNKETKPIFEVAYLWNALSDFTQICMWSTEVGRRVHSKNCLVSSRQHRATEVGKLCFCSSCQYTHRCCALASWAARHTTVCLDLPTIL